MTSSASIASTTSLASLAGLAGLTGIPSQSQKTLLALLVLLRRRLLLLLLHDHYHHDSDHDKNCYYLLLPLAGSKFLLKQVVWLQRRDRVLVSVSSVGVHGEGNHCIVRVCMHKYMHTYTHRDAHTYVVSIRVYTYMADISRKQIY